MKNNLDEILGYLSSKFSKYNTVDLLSKISTLRLLPQNGDHQIRLDAFLHAATVNNNNDNRYIKRSEMIRIINSPKVKHSYITHAEDPRTQLLCEEIAFFGGGYRIFPGIYDSIVFNFTHLLKSLFQPKTPFLPKDISNELMGIAKFILEMNESIASRAKIKRNTDISFYKEIYIPPTNQLEIFSSFIKFTYDEIKNLIERCNITIDNIRWLFTEIANVNLELYTVEKGQLLDSPIVVSENTYIVTDPSSLLFSYQKKVLETMKNNNLLKEFNKGYREAIWHTVITRLDWMDIKKINKPPHRVHNDIPIVDGLFNFEQDKVLVGILVTDDFGDSEEDFVSIDLNNFSDRLNIYSEILYSLPSPPNQILYLFLSSHYFRPFSYELFIPPYDSSFLALSADNLNIISMLEGGKNNFLLKYSYAQEKIRNTTEIVAFDKLSEYYFFQNHHYSYYFDDDRKPTMLHIGDDFARAARKEALEKLDSHTVFNPLNNSYVEVISLSGKELPLYIPHYFPSYIEVVLETFPIKIWFYNYDDSIKSELRSIAIEFIDMIAYWFNELKPGLQNIMFALQTFTNNIIIKIELTDSVLWTRPVKDSGNISTKPVEIDFINSNQFKFTFAPISNALLFGDTNEGERKIIYQILKGMELIFKEYNLNGDFFTETNLSALIDKYLPLGRKKKLCIYNTAIIPEIDPRDLPSLRIDQEIDTNLILDEIGENIINKKKSVGQTPEDQVKFINKNVVGYLWNKLNMLLLRFDTDSIIDYLLRQNEALISQKTLYEIQLPMRLEITDPDRVIEEFKEGYNKVINSSPACRFLIECVTALNSKGIKIFSDSDYDEILAISKEIISWGFTSDLIHSQISDMRISILPSNRIGRSRKGFDEALQNFSEQILKTRKSKFSDRFNRYWDMSIPKKRKDSEMDVLSNALINEYGFGLEDLIEFKLFLFRVSDTKNSTIIYVEENEFYEMLTKEEKIGDSRIVSLIKYFTLTYRKNFFLYPKLNNLKKEDLYPWRFNRRLSYVRRPIIRYLNNDNKTMLAFGIRQIQISFDNLIGIISTGRIQNEVETNELKSILGKLAEPLGKYFNDKVAEVFNNSTRFISKKNVEKFGYLKIENSKKEPLGDIDIFVIDRKSSKVLLIECKDLLVSKTPYEMMLEMKKVYEGEKSHMKMFQKRITWVKDNFSEITKFYKLSPNRKWKIKSYFVVNEPLFGSHLRSYENITTLTYLEIKEKYLQI